MALAALSLAATADLAAQKGGSEKTAQAFRRMEAMPAPVDISWVSRSLKKTPTFKSQNPRFSIWVLGEGKQSAMVLAWDESEGTGKGYDTLYADKNLNGDLTEDGEKFFRPNVDPKTNKKAKGEPVFKIGTVKELGGSSTFTFKLGSAYFNDQLTYPSSISVKSRKGDFTVGCLPSNLKLRWGPDLKTAPIYCIAGEAIPLVNGKHPGQSLGTWAAGRTGGAGYTVKLLGGDLQTELRFAFSNIGRHGKRPQTVLRVKGEGGKILEEIAFHGGCTCGGGYGQKLIIPSRVPPGLHEVVARTKRPLSLGGNAEFIFPVKIENPMYGKPFDDPAYKALKTSFPDARIISLRRKGPHLETSKGFKEEPLIPARTADTHLRQDGLLYEHHGYERTFLVGARAGDGRGHRYHALIKFGLEALPRDAKVLGAQLRLTLVASDMYSYLKQGAHLQVYGMRREWTEKHRREHGANAIVSNWHGPVSVYPANKIVKRVPWGKPGADDPMIDRYPDLAADVEVDHFPSGFKPYDKNIKEPWRMIALDISNLVQKWQAGEIENHGMLMKLNGSISSYICASEFPDYPFRPTLIIAYEGSAPIHATSGQPERDLALAKKRALQHKRPLAIEFTSKMCGSCIQADQTTFADASVKKTLKDKFQFVKLEIADHAKLAQQYGVSVTPSVVIVDSDGKTRKKLIGGETVMKKDAFLAALNDSGIKK